MQPSLNAGGKQIYTGRLCGVWLSSGNWQSTWSYQQGQIYHSSRTLLASREFVCSVTNNWHCNPMGLLVTAVNISNNWPGLYFQPVFSSFRKLSKLWRTAQARLFYSLPSCPAPWTAKYEMLSPVKSPPIRSPHHLTPASPAFACQESLRLSELMA